MRKRAKIFYVINVYVCDLHATFAVKMMTNKKKYQEISNLLIAIINKVTLYAHAHTNSILHAFALHANTTLQCQFHHSVSLITLDHY